MEGNNNDNIKSILSGIFGANSKLSKGYNRYTVEQVWRSTFGEVISRHTTGVKFSKGVLEVFINSSSLKQELDMTKDKVIAKLNSKLDHHKVVKLVIR